MDAATRNQDPDLTSLAAQLQALQESVDLVLERQRAFSELMDESGPILMSMMKAGTQTLGDLEERGYFEFGKAALGLLDRVVTTYGAEDVDQLSDAVVGILDTVRHATQPEVLALANDATDVLQNAGDLEPVSVMGALKKSRDADVQRGLAVMLRILRSVGQAAGAAGNPSGKKGLARHLAPSKKRAPVKRRAPADRCTPAHRPPRSAPKRVAPDAPVVEASLVVPGFELNPQGYLMDPSTWTEEFAGAMAAQLGIADLSPEHWKVIDYARAEFHKTGVSPNIRKVAKGADVPIKSIYTLFHKAPGRTAARIAGVPKPAGCI